MNFIVNKKIKELKMAYCANCGAKVQKNQVYCHKCGEKIRELKSNVSNKRSTNNSNQFNKIVGIFIVIIGILFIVGLIVTDKDYPSPKEKVKVYETFEDIKCDDRYGKAVGELCREEKNCFNFCTQVCRVAGYLEAAERYTHTRGGFLGLGNRCTCTCYTYE